MLKQLLSVIKITVLAIVLSFGLSYALAWTAPTATPPNGNTDAPINIGSTPQTKVGGDICTTVSGNTKCLQTVSGGAGAGDNLGNHTATTSLNMAGFNINNANNIVSTGNGAATFGPNSSWGAYLTVGGNGRTTTNASVAATNGNLHLDSQNGGYGTYINYYSGGPVVTGGRLQALGGYVGNATTLTPHYINRYEDSYGGWTSNAYQYCGGYYNHDTCPGADGDNELASCPANYGGSCVDAARQSSPFQWQWCLPTSVYKTRNVTCNINEVLSTYDI